MMIITDRVLKHTDTFKQDMSILTGWVLKHTNIKQDMSIIRDWVLEQPPTPSSAGLAITHVGWTCCLLSCTSVQYNVVSFLTPTVGQLL